MLFYLRRLLYRFLGMHLCEQFTKWEIRHVVYSRLAKPEEAVIHRIERVEFSEDIQERTCVECGKVQQRKLWY